GRRDGRDLGAPALSVPGHPSPDRDPLRQGDGRAGRSTPAVRGGTGHRGRISAELTAALLLSARLPGASRPDAADARLSALPRPSSGRGNREPRAEPPRAPLEERGDKPKVGRPLRQFRRTGSPGGAQAHAALTRAANTVMGYTQ